MVHGACDLQPPAIGIVAISSSDYVHHMLNALQDGRPTVPLLHIDDHDRLQMVAVDDVITPKPGGGWLELPFNSPDDDKLAMISFTSGTEGMPKAVHLSRGNLHDVVRRLNQAMQLNEDIREYIGVPVYHSFGYGRCRAVLQAGGKAYLPSDGFDLNELRGLLKADEINAISAVPSLFQVILQARDQFGSECKVVRWIEIGSQYMPADQKKALREMFPNALILQHYGLTEASRTTFLRIDKAAGEPLESVGRAIEKTEVKINPDGLICIRGPHVATTVQHGHTQVKLTADEWLVTSDKGHIENGFVYFEGRADDLINCGGLKLSPDLIEAYLSKQFPQVSGFGVMRSTDALRGEGILLVLEPIAESYEADLKQAIADYAQRNGLEARHAIKAKYVAQIPRTATDKFQRKALAEQIEADDETAKDQPDAPAGDFLSFVKQILGKEALRAGVCFQDLGADSLSHMQISLALERALGVAPSDWEWLPFMTLQAEIEANGDFTALMQHPGGAPALPDGSRNMNPDDISFWGLVKEDFLTNDRSLFHQGFLMLFVHRFGNWRMDLRPKLLRAPFTVLYRFLNKLTQILFGMKLDYTVQVGRRVKLEHFGGMILGARQIGDDVVIRQNTTFGIRSTDDLCAKPIIGNRVDIGAGAVVVGNITVGENAIIGANSVVFSNVPKNTVVIGVPARAIGTNPRRNPSPLKSP